MKNTYNYDDVVEAVRISKTGADALRMLGRKTRGGSTTAFFRYLKRNHVDHSHFTWKGSRPAARKHWSEHLIQGMSKNASTLRRSMLEAGFEHKCNKCGVGDIWENQKLVLQIEHKDGNHENNLKENLEFLCPNCHSQTETYGVLKGFVQNKCACGKAIQNHSEKCVICHNKKLALRLRLNSKCPPIDCLEKMIWEKPTTKIAEEFGVSDKAVEKWCKKYNIQKPGKGYWMKRKD